VRPFGKLRAGCPAKLPGFGGESWDARCPPISDMIARAARKRVLTGDCKPALRPRLNAKIRATIAPSVGCLNIDSTTAVENHFLGAFRRFTHIPMPCALYEFREFVSRWFVVVGRYGVDVEAHWITLAIQKLGVWLKAQNFELRLRTPRGIS
jgi:hypothetical protein